MYSDTEWQTVYRTPTYTITYTTTRNNGETTSYFPIRKFSKQQEPPELETGDTAALDEFLGRFKQDEKE